MKTPISTTWMTSLLMAVALASDSQAQSQTNLLTTVQRLDDATSLRQPRSPKPQPSRCTAELVRLAQSGIDESVMLGFIANSSTFNLAADHIVYLNELGVSGQVIRAMLQHDRELNSRPQPSAIVSMPASPTASDETSAKPAAATSMDLSLADASIDAALPGVKLGRPDSQLGATVATAPQLPQTLNSSTPFGLVPEPPKKKKLYPVREPYPVELTAPIVFLDAPSF